jgi:hypothetical protein
MNIGLASLKFGDGRDRIRNPAPAHRNIAALVGEDAGGHAYARALPARTLTLIFITSPPFVFSL